MDCYNNPYLREEYAETKNIPPDLSSPQGWRGFKIKRRRGGRQVSLAVLGYSGVTGTKSAPRNPPKPAS